MFGGFTLKLKDKSVGRLINRHSLEADEVFHSPIKTWRIWWFFMIVTALPILALVFAAAVNTYPFELLVLLLVLIFIGYLFTAAINRSFAFAGEELIVLKPHFPFTGLNRYKLADIDSVEINADGQWKWLIIFAVVSSGNYVRVKMKDGSTHKHYCLFLETASHDENWTEKNLDDLATYLKGKGVQVDMNL